MKVLAEEGTDRMIEEIKKLKGNTGASGTTLYVKFYETLRMLIADNSILSHYAFQQFDSDGDKDPNWKADDWNSLIKDWKSVGVDYRDVIELARIIDPTKDISLYTPGSITNLWWVFDTEYSALTCTDVGWGTMGYSYDTIFRFSDVPFIKYVMRYPGNPYPY